MAQYCPRCKWYSADGLTHCSTCGAPFELDADEPEDEPQEEEERPLLERIGWWLALVFGAIVGGIALYNRFVTPENVGAAGAAVGRVADGFKGAARAISTFLLGPNGEYQDFAVILLGTSALVWFALWLMARLGRR